MSFYIEYIYYKNKILCMKHLKTFEQYQAVPVNEEGIFSSEEEKIDADLKKNPDAQALAKQYDELKQKYANNQQVIKLLDSSRAGAMKRARGFGWPKDGVFKVLKGKSGNLYVDFTSPSKQKGGIFGSTGVSMGTNM